MLISKIFLSVVAFALVTNISEVGSANILFYFGSSIYSHRVAVWPLVLKLSENGHDITFLSPTPPKENLPTNVKITEFHPKSLVIYWKEKEGNNKTRDVITSRVKGFSDGPAYWDGVLQTALEVCRVIFRSYEVQKWAEDSFFDLVVIDTPYNECALGLVHKLASPHILFGTVSLYMWHQEMFGLPDETSWLPNYYNHFSAEMNFFQRVRNALTPLQWFYSTNRVSYIIPQLEQLMRKSLNITDMPSFDELEKSTSLFLLNTHFSQEYPRSLPPFVISVGGMHCELDAISKNQKLSEELEIFLNEYASNEFIYMSFGSLVQFSKAPQNLIEKFINAFKMLDIPVLWKWDDNDKIPEDTPKNIFMSNWFPQTLLLEHPKLKLFISHGGALSFQEAIYKGIPMLVFPLTPEEDYNAEIIERSVAGIRLDIIYFTQYELSTSVRKIIADETFKNNMMRLSVLFKDRPQSPVNTAVWWTEYVLRHRNLTFTKPLAIHQSWYQRRLLDVWGFLGLVFFGSLTILVVSINYIFCTKAPPPKIVKHKHKQS